MSSSQKQPTDAKPTLQKNPLIPDEEHRLRENDGVIRPPNIQLRPHEEEIFNGSQDQQPNRGHVKFTDELKQRYIELYAAYGVRSKCAKAVGVCPLTVVNHMKSDPEFGDAVELAMEVFRDSIEETIIDRAIHGWLEPVVSAGKVVTHVRKFDNRLLEALAKRHIVAYREKQQVDVNISGGVLVAPAPVKDGEDWRARHLPSSSEQARLPSKVVENTASEEL